MKSMISKYTRHTLCNRKVTGKLNLCEVTVKCVHVITHEHVQILLYMLCEHITVHMETIDSVVCIDRTPIDTDYSF